MMQENMLLEHWQDAARDVIRAAGGTKAVAQMLFPSKPIHTAIARLNDALNPALEAKLSPDEFLHLAKIGRRNNCHALARFFCEEVGYQAPVARHPEDQKQRLMREFVETGRLMKALAERIERVE